MYSLYGKFLWSSEEKLLGGVKDLEELGSKLQYKQYCFSVAFVGRKNKTKASHCDVEKNFYSFF